MQPKVKIIEINGKPGIDDGYYDGLTSEKAVKPEYVLTLIEQRKGLEMEQIILNTRDQKYLKIGEVPC